MTGQSNFWDVSMWSFVITLALLFTAMLLANILRRKLRFLRQTLIPSSVLGGFLALGAGWLYRRLTGEPLFPVATLEALTYHGLGLGFVAMALRRSESSRGREQRRAVFATSTVTVGSYLLQGMLGLLITLTLHRLIGSYAAAGVLLPMGYGQGPGQAYNWGSIYQNYTAYPAFANGASFGLTVAAMGFVSASVGGVLFLNRLRKSGDPRVAENAEEIENLSAEDITAKGEIPLSESMDKLTVQLALCFVCYGAAYAGMQGITVLLDALGGFAVNTVKPLIWGFNFLTGTATAILCKALLGLLRRRGVMHREYTNNFLLSRISGVMFDLMVTASIAAIDLSAFRYREFWLPLVLLCVVGAVATYVYNRWICRRLFPGYAEEAFLSLYGMLTGTASTGVILLREIDPLFSTPASHNLVFQNLWSIVLGAPMLLLLGFVARSLTWTWISLGALAVLFGLILLWQLLSHRKKDT